jgi:hypothetical protein
MQLKEFPHCDAKILHAPGECKFCDRHADWQELRRMWGIAFTGHADDVVETRDWNGNPVTKTLIPCPSEWSRPVSVINKWAGNRAQL